MNPVRNDLEAARQDVLTGLASNKLSRDILHELVKSDSFKPVGAPSVLARMYRGPDGLYLGHATGADGKMIGNVRWVKLSGLGSRLLTSAGMLSGHLMLVEISNKIDQVQKDVEAIRNALDDDRMQSLKAAVYGVRDAVEMCNNENKNLLMIATIPELQKATFQTINALAREISEVPVPKEWHISRFISDREPEMRSKLAKSEATLQACLEGIATISQAYFTIGEPDVGLRAATRLCTELLATGLAEAEFKARLLTPSNADDRPEEQWGKARRLLSEMIELLQIEAARTTKHTAEFDVELLPAEIEEALRNSVQERAEAENK